MLRSRLRNLRRPGLPHEWSSAFADALLSVSGFYAYKCLDVAQVFKMPGFHQPASYNTAAETHDCTEIDHEKEIAKNSPSSVGGVPRLWQSDASQHPCICFRSLIPLGSYVVAFENSTY